jgi:siroheme synthase, N-terminal domain
MINIKGKRIVIIGGGEVALRKAKVLLQYNADITVISPEFAEGFKELEGKVHLLTGNYKEDFIKDAFMVITGSTSEEVNEAAGAYCRKNNILCNRADDSSNSDFHIPSVLKRGDLTIAVSTGASSPALAAKIRGQLEDIYTEEYADYVELLGEIRKEILINVEDDTVRSKLLRELIDLSLEELKERRGLYEGSSRFKGKQAGTDSD